MAGITDFADLKARVATVLNRANMTADIPYCVQLAETRIHYGSKEQPFPSDPLRIRAMEVCASATFDEQEIALPDGFLQIRRIFIAGTPNGRIDYNTPDQFWPDVRSTTEGQPKIFTIEGDSIFLAPYPGGSYTGKILYYKKFDALEDEDDTNWLLTNAPGVYLYATLLEAFSQVRNVEQATLYLNKFAGTVNALNSADKADRYSTPWAAHSDTSTP